MSLAGFDLLLGARASVLAAAMLVGCSGGTDDSDTPDVGDDAAFVSDARIDRGAGDAHANNDADRSVMPKDSSQPDVSIAEASATDVAADVPVLALCLRLLDPANKDRQLELSEAVGDAYLLLIRGDCTVYKATTPPGGALALAAWRNALYAYNLDLWGCSTKAATGFALVSTALPGVSTADTTQLIELYLKAATIVLALSSREVADLRRDLQRLAGPVVTNESTDYTLSNCPSEAGAEAEAEAGAIGVDAPIEADAPEATDAFQTEQEPEGGD